MPPFWVSLFIDIAVGLVLIMQSFLERLNSRLPSVLTLRIFPPLLLWCFLCQSCRSCAVDVFVVARYPMPHCSLHCIQLWFAEIVSICCGGASLKRGSSYKYKIYKVVTDCAVKTVAEVFFFLRSVTSVAQRTCKVSDSSFFPVEWALMSVQ